MDELFAKEFAPRLAQKDALPPALVFLHGRGSDENDLPGLREFLDPRFHCISVRAPFPFEFGGYTWYELLGIGHPEPVQFNESYSLLTRFIERLRSRTDIDPNRIALFGFSMGSMMALTFALRNPHAVRAVVAHSGYIPEVEGVVYPWNDLQSLSLFVAHGSLDPVVPVTLGRRAQQLLARSNADFLFKEYPIPHSISDESLDDISRWLRVKIDHPL